MMSHYLTDEQKARITEVAEEVAEFEAGDNVTVEPTDHGVSYCGKELEGVHLVVSGVTWRGNDVENHADDYEVRWPDQYEEERRVECEDGEDLYLSSFEYQFEQPALSMSSRAVISWDEYKSEHDRVKLFTDENHTSVFLEPCDPCEVCGCNRERVSHYDNGVVQAGSVKCPACGTVKEQHAP